MTITSIGFGVVAVVIGVIVASANYGVTRYEIPYPPTCRVGQPCTIQFRPDRDLSGPVYFHYKIEGMYQNHRRYVKSRSGAQLRGEPGAATGSCQPLERNGARVLYPCGLIAASKFGDRIALRIDGASQTGSSWDSEPIWTQHDRAYYRPNEQYQNEQLFSKALESGLDGRPVQLPSVTDPDLAVWMHTAALSTFTKLYRVRHASEPIKAGALLEFVVDNEFDPTPFQGRKSLLITTMSFMGGRQTFLAWAWIALALGCFGFAALIYYVLVR